MDMILLQLEQPPADFLNYLLWTIGILVTCCGSLFLLLKTSYENRLNEKDNQIERLTKENTELSTTLKNKVYEANQMAETILTLLKNEKH